MTRLVGVVLLAVIGAVTPVSAQEPRVRIHNRTDHQVTVLIQNIDFLGNKSWQPIGTAPPKGSLEIPGVPAGALLGAQDDRGRQWNPFQVTYGGRPPIFEWELRP
jgi:hypothetical protein